MREIKQLYRKIYWAAVFCGLCASFFIIFQPKKMIGFSTFIILMISGIFLLKFSITAMRILPGKAPILPLLTGLLLITSGALFDILITITYSPDLSREANKIVRFFIDFGFSLSQIYLIGMISQILYISILSILWTAFLKAYPLLLQQIPSSANLLKVAISIFGGPNATKLDLFIGKVDCFFHVTSLTPMVVALSFYRLYLGLEWLQIVPISRIAAPAIISLSALSLYTYISYKQLINDTH